MVSEIFVWNYGTRPKRWRNPVGWFNRSHCLATIYFTPNWMKAKLTSAKSKLRPWGRKNTAFYFPRHNNESCSTCRFKIRRTLFYSEWLLWLHLLFYNYYVFNVSVSWYSPLFFLLSLSVFNSNFCGFIHCCSCICQCCNFRSISVICSLRFAYRMVLLFSLSVTWCVNFVKKILLLLFVRSWDAFENHVHNKNTMLIQ